MSVELALTDEQAKWLKEHLADLLTDAYWGQGVLRRDKDAHEHAETIVKKIDKIEKSRSWD